MKITTKKKLTRKGHIEMLLVIACAVGTVYAAPMLQGVSVMLLTSFAMQHVFTSRRIKIETDEDGSTRTTYPDGKVDVQISDAGNERIKKENEAHAESMRKALERMGFSPVAPGEPTPNCPCPRCTALRTKKSDTQGVRHDN